MKKSIVAATVAFALASIAAPAGASVTTYDDQSVFSAALTSYETETFNSSTLNAGLSYISTNGTIVGGLFNDMVVLGSATTQFSFGTAVNGFGGLFDERPSDFGQGIAFTLTLMNNQTVVLSQQVWGATGEFFGFISTDKFNSVLLTAGTSPGYAETYTLDNLQYGVTAVPEPETYAMMMAGLGMLGFVARRKKSS